MAKKQIKSRNKGASAHKARSTIRVIIGLVLFALVVTVALIVIIDMRQRINIETNEATKSLLWRGLQNDYIVFGAMLIVTLGIIFGLAPRKRNVALCIAGCIIWGISLLVTAEAVYLSVRTVVRSNEKEINPEASHLVVMGTALNPNSSAPYDLSVRLDTAAEWWLEHQEHDVIVTTGTDFVPVETADGGEVTTVENTTQNTLSGRGDDKKKQGTSTSSVMINILRKKGVLPRVIDKETASTNTREIFDEILKLKDSHRKPITTDTPIIIVTNGCYMNDTVRIAREAGFTDISRLPAPSSFSGYLTNVLWETWLTYDPFISKSLSDEL